MATWFTTFAALGAARPEIADIPGEMILGGLFPVHSTNGSACGKIMKGRGIHRVMAMLYAVEAINNSTKILPNITLGTKIQDTCSQANYALNMSIDFVTPMILENELENFACPNYAQPPEYIRQPKPLVGVIGASYSGVSTIVAQLLRIYKIAQISPASTTADLSDKTRFEYFARTVPSDRYQGMVLADILTRFNWSYVSLVYSEDDYGRTGADYFKMAATNRNICISMEGKISGSFFDSREVYVGVIDRLREEANFGKPTGSRAVVLYTRKEHTQDLLRAAASEKLMGIQWVSAEGWATLSNEIAGGVEEYAQGAMVIAVRSDKVEPFNKYFQSNVAKYAKNSKWVREYWEEEFRCSIDQTSTNRPTSGQFIKGCNFTEVITDQMLEKIDDKVEFVIAAVYSIAHALHSLVEDKCGGPLLCPDILSTGQSSLADGVTFYRDYLMNVNFTTPGHGDRKFHFDEFGDGPPHYVIKNLKRNKQMPKRWYYEKVGEWRNSELTFDPIESIDWPEGLTEPKTSTCAVACLSNQVKKTAGSKCCWVCVDCRPRERVKDEFTCTDCGIGHWPDVDFGTCYKIADRKLEVIEWLTVHSLIPVALSLLGIIGTSLIVAVMLKHNQTPIVKASGRELSYTMLSGIYLCYFMTFIIVARPSGFICALRRIGIGLSFAILYSALLVKTNRIYRIFESAKRTPVRPKLIDPKSQLVITGVLVSIQFLSGVLWLILQFPGTKVVYPDPQPRAVLMCNAAGQWFLVSLLYDGILICICTYYAIKTRLVPENFNEAKFIGFSMYTTCVIWLSFVPIYYGTGNNYKIQTTTLCVSISLSATATLCCLYLPKVYVIFSDPQRESKSAGVPTLSRGGTEITSNTPTPSIYSPLLKDGKPNVSQFLNRHEVLLRSASTRCRKRSEDMTDPSNESSPSMRSPSPHATIISARGSLPQTGRTHRHQSDGGEHMVSLTAI